MILISLDETGKFEYDNKSKEKVGYSLVGGIIYSYRNPSDLNRELSRIQAFFQKVCEELGCTYPYDLHYNWENGIVQNSESATKVKHKLEEELPDFIRGSGKWSSDRPRGTYYSYALVTDKYGVEDTTKTGISNLVDDNLASNRYEHMAYRVVENLLFFNPYINDKSVKLELATRSVPPSEMSDPVFKTLGYSRNTDNALYSVTNAAGYKAALSAALHNSARSDIQFDIKVQSINYHEGDINYHQGFLYMADTICGIFDKTAKGAPIGSDILRLLQDQGYETFGAGKALIYSYSKIDEVFRDAYRKVETGNYFQALYAIIQAELQSIRHGVFYRRHWFNAIEKFIANDSSNVSLQIALVQLDHYLDTPSYNQIAAEYIHDQLSQQAANMPDHDLSDKLLFMLYRTKMRICNHNGDYSQALDAYEKCISKAQYVSVEDYLDLRNLYCVALQDNQKYMEASECVNQTVEYEEMLVDIKKEIYPVNDKVFLHYGRTCSLQGQSLAYLCRYEASAVAFEKALEAFGNDEIERSFTLSLYLHMLIEQKDQATYEKNAEAYFGSADLQKQFDLIAQQKNKSHKYMLFVYVKALYCFYRDGISNKFIERLIRKIEKLYSAVPDSHPWEMILKYCAFLELHINSYKISDHSDYLMEKSDAAIAHAVNSILQRIQDENRRQYRALCEGKTLDSIFMESEVTYMHR